MTRHDPEMHISTRRDHLDGLLSDLGIQHFSASELGELTHPDWSGPDYALPDYTALGNILLTVRLADAIRHRWGRPIMVVSGYRPPEYNTLVGGSDSSQHVAFRALDIRPVDDTFDESRFFECCNPTVQRWRERGVNVGYGRYPDSRFVHLDTCAHTGAQREWWG